MCSKVYLSLFLERKVNGSYSTYKILEFTAKNVTSLKQGTLMLLFQVAPTTVYVDTMQPAMVA
ncbi:MAG: hypothetical protein V8Q86_00275 [Blautia sp.]